MSNPNFDPEYRLTDADVEVCRAVEAVIHPMLTKATAIFMSGCISQGVCPKVAAGAYALMLCTNVARVTAIAAKLEPHIANQLTPQFTYIGFDCQRLIGEAVDKLINEELPDTVKGN